LPEWECISKIEIDVSDSNDNSPVFSQDVFSASLKEDTPVGSIAIKIHATDADLGVNRRIEYDFIDSAKGHSKIDTVSGIVSLAKPLDREEKAMFNLTVRATDGGRPRLSSITNMMVLVLVSLSYNFFLVVTDDEVCLPVQTPLLSNLRSHQAVQHQPGVQYHQDGQGHKRGQVDGLEG